MKDEKYAVVLFSPALGFVRLTEPSSLEEAASERFFFAIKPGDKPETSQFSALAAEWIEAWLRNMRAAFGGVVLADAGLLRDAFQAIQDAHHGISTASCETKLEQAIAA